jgi:hypothetical protein
MRWASPSTPTSLRMVSWIDLIVVVRDMQVSGRGNQAAP